MNLRDIHVINPFDEKDMSMIKEFDIDLYKRLQKNITNKSYIEYKKNQEYGVLTERYFCSIDNNKITNFITAIIQKDTKIANIYPTINIYKKNLISNVCDFLITNGMEEVFVFIKKSDSKKMTDLINNNFISLSTDDDYILLLKEKEEEEKESSVSWNY